MRKINIIVLGSTGSIGTQTLQVLKKHKHKFNLLGIACHSNGELLQKQAKQFKVQHKVLVSARQKTADRAGQAGRTGHAAGQAGLKKLIQTPKADLIINAISGSAGLAPSKETLKAGKPLALANKESIILGGKTLNALAKKHNTKILPLDSEHHAVLRLLQAKNLKKYTSNKVKKITITCSGGPFYGFTRERLEKVTPKDALKNPNWKMGPKILIESATLLNKGFELIEAHHLFNCPLKNLDAVIDRKSFIHAIVEFKNPKETLALAYKPDMKIVIEDTLLDFYHKTRNLPFKNKKLKFIPAQALKTYPFKPINHKTFPAIQKTLKTYSEGNIATFYKKSEKNIEAFLEGKAKFTEVCQ